MSRIPAFVLLLLLTATSGCQYAENRFVDLLDVVPASIGTGWGLSAQARVTPYVGVGAGYAATQRAGWDVGRFGSDWTEAEVGVPLVQYRRRQSQYFGETTEGDRDAMTITNVRHVGSSFVFVPGLLVDEAGGHPMWPRSGVEREWEWTKWSGWDFVYAELGAHAIIVGLRVGASPAQAVDFLAGLFNLDPAGDDRRGPGLRWNGFWWEAESAERVPLDTVSSGVAPETVGDATE